MTYEEALDSLTATYVMIKNDDYVDADAFRVARLALEKQISKKVSQRRLSFGVANYCPRCEKCLDLDRVRPTYCPDCGQRIDWKWNR